MHQQIGSHSLLQMGSIAYASHALLITSASAVKPAGQAQSLESS